MTEATELSLTVPAHAAAIAWINAFLATGEDDARPGQFQTLCVECFEKGVQFIALDGHLLLRTWVPTEPEVPWPEREEAPDRSFIVMDAEGFGLGFMRVLARLTADEDHAHEVLQITLSPHDTGAELLLSDEFMTERLSLRASGQRIDLRLFEGDYVNWREAYRRTGGDDRTERVLLPTEYLGVIGKLKECQSIDLMFSGDEKAIWLKGCEVLGGPTRVLGILMPLRKVA